MRSANLLDFSASRFETQPFPHFCASAVLAPALERGLYEWLEDAATWELTTTDFYEQYEFSLLHIELPVHLRCLVEGEVTRLAIAELESAFHASDLELVGVTIHKLTDGQRIGVHNDFIGPAESHRLIIQVNQGWTEANGGFQVSQHLSVAPPECLQASLREQRIGLRVAANGFDSDNIVPLVNQGG